MLVLTGAPGVGKTTVIAKTVSALRGKGVFVGGTFTREVRKDNVRVGFEVVDVAAARVGWLASVNQLEGPQVGKYRVNLSELEAIGVQAIEAAIAAADVVVIDEIGPMELFSEKFKVAAQKALESVKPIVAIVHLKTRDQLGIDAKSRGDAEVYMVTEQNRNTLPEVLVPKILRLLGGAT